MYAYSHFSKQYASSIAKRQIRSERFCKMFHHGRLLVVMASGEANISWTSPLFKAIDILIKLIQIYMT